MMIENDDYFIEMHNAFDKMLCSCYEMHTACYRMKSAYVSLSAYGDAIIHIRKICKYKKI